MLACCETLQRKTTTNQPDKQLSAGDWSYDTAGKGLGMQTRGPEFRFPASLWKLDGGICLLPLRWDMETGWPLRPDGQPV